MAEIKICGITTVEDAIMVAQSGADALGFIFHPPSPRSISPRQARAIARELPPGIARVGVFVDREPEEVMHIARSCHLDFVQLHGNEPPGHAMRFPEAMVIKAFSPGGPEDLERILSYPARAVLLDGGDPLRAGGTGRKTDWKLAARVAESRWLILAGGLYPGNLREAVETVFPHGLDAASGVEISPGKKDPAKVKALLGVLGLLGGGKVGVFDRGEGGTCAKTRSPSLHPLPARK